ncbi:MAG: hypothetical protein EBZ68_01125, partial [Actinobacteria bacterium]|nr:hypothetical protein [Actinomycetota bacterium]NDE67063.1 hypothetical protein [Actinomycetota bacterium]
TEDIQEAIHKVNTEADVVWVDGHSDYGHAFEVFWDRYGKDVNPTAEQAHASSPDHLASRRASTCWRVLQASTLQARRRLHRDLRPDPVELGLAHRARTRRLARRWHSRCCIATRAARSTPQRSSRTPANATSSSPTSRRAHT